MIVEQVGFQDATLLIVIVNNFKTIYYEKTKCKKLAIKQKQRFKI